MRTRQEILDEIKRTTKENGGKPLGISRFEKETGINTYDWGRFWPRFSEAQLEAGFAPNQLTGAFSDEFLVERVIELARKLGKFPTSKEMRVERNNNPAFPDSTVFNRLGSKQELVVKVVAHCENKDGYGDILKFCASILKSPSTVERSEIENDYSIGEVYLFKSGRYYKIGKTNDTVRRGQELSIQLPDPSAMVHLIKTDDPSGVERYWHRRFEAKRKNGEWFDLNSADIRAFKRWRRIY
jgi:hypothetical protein